MGQFIFIVIYYCFLASCLIRHLVHTLEAIHDFAYKVKNRRLERFKH